MRARKFIRDNEYILISEYGFEWYKNNELVRWGLVEDIDLDIQSIINEGFKED